MLESLDIGYWLRISIQFFLVISCLILATSWKRQFLVFTYFTYFVFLNMITEFSARIFVEFGENNLPLLHLYTLGEFILLSFFFKQLFTNQIAAKKKINIFILIVSILIILNSIFLQSIFGFNSYAKTLVQCILIAYSLFYFVGIDSKIEGRNDKEKARLIVNVAILIYYSGSLFIFMFSDFFLRYGNGISRNFWMFNAGLNLIFQLIILAALWKVFRKKKYIF